MAAEAAGRAYINTDEKLKAHLTAHAEAWARLGVMADQQDAHSNDVLREDAAFKPV